MAAVPLPVKRVNRHEFAGRDFADPTRSVRAVSTRICLAADNRALHDAVARVLVKQPEFSLVPLPPGTPFAAELLAECEADILLLSSSANFNSDLALVRSVRTLAEHVQILMFGMASNDGEMLQYVRAGVRGCLDKDASAGAVVDAIRRVQAGEAVCTGRFCGLLFRYFEREATEFPSASVRQKLGLTRREQQIVPFIARGLTNKEIANQFCLSEQTVKNHLYRMKQKVGAGDRLSIVQVCRSHGFLV